MKGNIFTKACLLTVFLITLSVGMLDLISFPAAWAASDEEAASDLVAKARKEGKVVLYHSTTVRDIQSLVKAFEAKYPPIKVESYRAGADKLLTKILSEVRANKYVPDVIEMRGFEISLLKQKGLLMKYNSPNYQSYPPEFLDPDGYWANLYYVTRTIAYNTKLVAAKDVPRRYEDLLKPQWKGQLAMDERDYEWFGNILEIMGQEKGMAFLKKLGQQKINFRSGRTLLVTLVAAGEFPVFLTASGYAVAQMKDEGAPVDWVSFDPTLVNLNMVAIAAHVNHPHAAKLFADFVSSKEGQSLVGSYGRSPSRPDVPQKFPKLTAGRKLLQSDVATDYTKYKNQFEEVFMRRK